LRRRNRCRGSWTLQWVGNWYFVRAFVCELPPPLSCGGLGLTDEHIDLRIDLPLAIHRCPDCCLI
jgi:hypothetical protein